MVQIEFCEKHGPDSLFFEVEECNDCNWVLSAVGEAIRKAVPKRIPVHFERAQSGKKRKPQKRNY